MPSSQPCNHDDHIHPLPSPPITKNLIPPARAPAIRRRRRRLSTGSRDPIRVEAIVTRRRRIREDLPRLDHPVDLDVRRLLLLEDRGGLAVLVAGAAEEGEAWVEAVLREGYDGAGAG